MSVTLSLWSTKQGEIRRFLHSFYQEDYLKEDGSRRWIRNFFNPMDSIDMISALIDNDDSYDVILYIHMDNGYLHRITKHNCDDVIKGLIGIYYVPVRCESTVEVM